MNATPFSLKGKSIFITGGASGIGLGQCLRFLQGGAHVVVADIKDPPAAALNEGAISIQCAVTDREQIIQAFASAANSIGALDVIVHNAGKPGTGVHIAESDEAVLDSVVALNFYGTYYVLKYGPRHMRDGGSIITTASVASPRKSGPKGCRPSPSQ